jgi:hypothetical protein
MWRDVLYETSSRDGWVDHLREKKIPQMQEERRKPTVSSSPPAPSSPPSPADGEYAGVQGGEGLEGARGLALDGASWPSGARSSHRSQAVQVAGMIGSWSRVFTAEARRRREERDF